MLDTAVELTVCTSYQFCQRMYPVTEVLGPYAYTCEGLMDSVWLGLATEETVWAAAKDISAMCS